MTRPPHFVIPAKAGIHGLNDPAKQRLMFKLDGQAMDSRFRGNDNGWVCEAG